MPTPRSAYFAKSSTGPQIDFFRVGAAAAVCGIKAKTTAARAAAAARSLLPGLGRGIGSPQEPRRQADQNADEQDAHCDEERCDTSRKAPSSVCRGPGHLGGVGAADIRVASPAVGAGRAVALSAART